MKKFEQNNSTEKEGPFITSLKQRGSYPAQVEGLFYIINKYVDPKTKEETESPGIRVKFKVSGYPEENPQYADWFVISDIIDQETFIPKPNAKKRLKSKALYDALNMRKDGACIFRAKYGNSKVENQADCDEILDFIKNQKVTIFLGKHNVKPDGNVYPVVEDVDVCEDQTSPF